MNHRLDLECSLRMGMQMHNELSVPTQLGLLLVDDEEFNIKALKRVLYDQGFSVYSANSGPAALDILEREDIAIVVTDMRMPQMSGVEFLKHVLDRWPETQRIVLTGHSDAHDAIEALNFCGIYRYICKPWDDEYLLSTIHEAAAMYWGGIMDRCFEKDVFEKNEKLKASNKSLIHSFEQSQSQLGKLADKLRKAYQDEKLLREERREAQRISEAKSRFLATISHEIRTPLNSIIATNALLLESQLNSEQRELVQLSLNGANILQTLINDILDFSKINAGHLDLQAEWFNVFDVVTATCKLLSGNIADKPVDIVVVVEPNAPLELYGDKTRFNQILTNLVSNATKFTEAGCISVRLSNHNGFHLSVNDTGPGIPSDKLQMIFEDFSQVDDSSTAAKGGTGLGLSISRKLCQLMNGELSVESKQGEGACFSAYLPLKGRNKLNFPKLDQTTRCLLLTRNESIYSPIKDLLAPFNCTLEVCNALNIPDCGEYDAVLYDTDSICVVHAPNWISTGENKTLHVALVNNDGVARAQHFKNHGIDVVLFKPLDIKNLYRDFLVKLPNVDSIQLRINEQTSFFNGVAQGATANSEDAPVLDLQGARILLAEDSPSNQAVIKSILNNMNVNIEIANDGLEAVKKSAAMQFDVIFMDMRMPEKNGLSAAQEIKQSQGLNSNTPIIALTANAYQEDREACAQAGMVDFISKPIDVGLFRDRLAHWVNIEPLSSCEKHIKESDKEDIVPEGSGCEALVDFDVLEQLKRDTSEEILPSILKIFITETELRLEALQTHCKTCDWPAIETEAHTLKSSAGSFGAVSLQVMACDLEAAAREENNAKLERLMNDLPAIVENTRFQLSPMCDD